MLMKSSCQKTLDPPSSFILELPKTFGSAAKKLWNTAAAKKFWSQEA